MTRGFRCAGRPCHPCGALATHAAPLATHAARHEQEVCMPSPGYDSRILAELYDSFPPYATRGDVDFFVSEAVNCKGPVLELGCGTGRVLLPTARAGIEICGLDSSSHMLERCREKLAIEP